MSFSPILLAVGVVACLLYLGYRAALPKPIPGIPYNKESAGCLFGDLKEVKNARYRRQWTWSQPRRHGSPISQAFLFPFRKPTVIVSDYREIVDICSRRTKEFDRGTRNRECVGLTAPYFHFTMESRDPHFRAHRELLRDLMTPWFLKTVAAPCVYEKSAMLVNLWDLKQSKSHGRPFTANHDLYLATLDTICGVAFGMDKSKAALANEYRHIDGYNTGIYDAASQPVDFPIAPTDADTDALLDIPEMIAIAQKSPFPALAQWLAMFKTKHSKAQRDRHSLVKRQTDESLKRMQIMGETYAPKSALDHLLQREMAAAAKTGRQPDLYSPIIRDELLGYLLGGHDSTATVLSWWVKHMQHYQSVQSRLRDYLKKAFPEAVTSGSWPTAEDISSASIPYLDAVIEESLRYASVATLIIRTATCDTQILGCHIPKGTDIVIPLTGPSMTEPALDIPESRRSETCRSAKDKVPAWGDDIREYKPERWLKTERGSDGEETEVFDSQAGPNLAFSVGPRQCFGRKQAQLQLRTAMILLLWNFEFEAVDAELAGWDITERLVNLPKDCYVKLKKL